MASTNRLESSGENCRAYFLIDNQKGRAWRSLKLDLFALDTDGVAAKRLAVEVGPVPEKKTLIKLFDFAGLACPRLGRVLLNDVMACEGSAGTREACLSAIETASVRRGGTWLATAKRAIVGSLPTAAGLLCAGANDSKSRGRR